MIRTRRSFGKGQVFWGMPLDKVLQMLKIQKDFEYSRPLDADIIWIHRRSGETDIYLIVNSSDREMKTECRFRVTGKEVEIWDPLTGQISPASYSGDKESITVPLQMTERQSLYILFRNKSVTGSRNIAGRSTISVIPVEGSWELTFQEGLGAPSHISMANLDSWTNNSDPGIKYYSGTVTYTRNIVLEKNLTENGQNVILDLGKVRDIAEVKVNGISEGIFWSYPFRCDISSLVKNGENKVEIKVTNEWTNRLIGDRQAKQGEKVLNSNLFIMGNLLNESGLPGPVRILVEK